MEMKRRSVLTSPMRKKRSRSRAKRQKERSPSRKSEFISLEGGLGSLSLKPLRQMGPDHILTTLPLSLSNILANDTPDPTQGLQGDKK